MSTADFVSFWAIFAVIAVAALGGYALLLYQYDRRSTRPNRKERS